SGQRRVWHGGQVGAQPAADTTIGSEGEFLMNRRNFLSSAAALAAARPAGAAENDAPPKGPQLHVAACQILTFPEPAKSAQKICAWIEKAAQDKVDVVVFPEAAICGYTCEPEYWKQANPRDFEAAERTVISAVQKLNIAAVVGTAHWEEGKVYDSDIQLLHG